MARKSVVRGITRGTRRKLPRGPRPPKAPAKRQKIPYY